MRAQHHAADPSHTRKGVQVKQSLVVLAFLCSPALGVVPDKSVLASCLMAKAAAPSVTVHEVAGRNIYVMENYANGFEATFFKIDGKDFGYAKGSGGFGLIYSGRVYGASTAIDLGNYITSAPDLNPVLGDWMRVRSLSKQYLCVSFPLGVLLVLAGPNYKTERDALAWIGYPATHSATEFEVQKGMPPRPVQALQAALNTATANAGKQTLDIGYVIHDAGLDTSDSQKRLRNLAHALTLDAPEFDMTTQAFNTPALLGEMGAGTALTNVALAIGYANHLGKNVLVAGTTDTDHPTAVLVTPPATVRPIEPDKPWYRARGGNHAYLMWWGIRHDETSRMQGYSD